MGAGREDRGRSGRKAERGGAPVADARYLPFGEERREEVDLPSDRGITNQRKEDFGLMDYNARYYDPYITQFTQPDSIIPDPYNPLDWNRYSYARYNPIRYSDPTGHAVADGTQGGCGLPSCIIKPPTPTPTSTPTPTPTSTPTPTPTFTPTFTPTYTYTPTMTATQGLVWSAQPTGTPPYRYNPGATPTLSPVPVPTISNETVGGIIDGASDAIDIAENQGMLPFHVPTWVGMLIDGGAQVARDWDKPYTIPQKTVRAVVVSAEGQIASGVGTVFAAPFAAMLTPEGGPIGAFIGAGAGYVGGNVLASRYLDGINETYVFPYIEENIP